MPSSRNIAGILSLCLGVLIFSLQDAIIKQVSGAYPVTEAVAIRSLVAIPILGCVVHFQTGLPSIASPRFGWMVLRALILFVSYLVYYMAFPALPLADAVALFFTTPLFVTVFAGPFLGERVSVAVWAAVVAGFAGVLIMLRPGTGVFEPAALLSLFSAAAYGTSMMMARKLGDTEPAAVMSFHQNWVVLTGALLLMVTFHALGIENATHPSLRFLVRPWVMPDLTDFLLMGACGAIAAAGMVLLTQAYRIAEANLVTSFEYTGILWAPLWGFLFWGEVPRWTTLAGAALIVAAGIIALRARPQPAAAKTKKAGPEAQPISSHGT